MLSLGSFTAVAELRLASLSCTIDVSCFNCGRFHFLDLRLCRRGFTLGNPLGSGGGIDR